MSINAHTYGDPYSGAGADTGSEGERPEGHRGQNGEADASPAAARLLEMTARETDQWRAEAQSEAAATVSRAREEAAQIVRAGREEAERMKASAREEAEQKVNDARVEAYRVREETTAVRKRHDEDVAHLRQLAKEQREQLRHHLTGMLDQVNATSEDGSQ